MNSFRFKWSILGITIGVGYFLAATGGDIDGFESISATLINWDHIELDELLLAMVAVLMFFVVDCIIMMNQRKLDKERIELYRATLDTTHHIMNNFLNQAQILELAVEEDPKFDPEILQMYQFTVDEAMEQLGRLDKLESIDPQKIRDAVFPSAGIKSVLPTNA